MKLTKAQKRCIDRLSPDGVVIKRVDGEGFTNIAGESVDLRLVSGLIEAGILVSGEDALFPEAHPQTFHLRQQS